MRKYKNKYHPTDFPSTGVFYDYSPSIMIEYLEWPYVRLYEFGKESVPLTRIVTIAHPYSNSRNTIYLNSRTPIKIPKVLDLMKHVSKLKQSKKIL